MFYLPVLFGRVSQDDTYSWHFCSCREGFSIVYTFNLSVSTSDNMDSVGCYFTIWSMLLLENFVTGDSCVTFR